ncbi:hypothetical protein FACS189499_08260 [Clostridia bacterium]|nr:hypothetical protein FACS189499_08260 [Clostridia bacterium]
MDCHLLYIRHSPGGFFRFFENLENSGKPGKPGKFKRKKSGFTLVELIVVIAIIGVLAAILIPLLTGYLSDARRASMASDAKGIYTEFAATVMMLETQTGVEPIDPLVEADISPNSGGINVVTLEANDMSAIPVTKTITRPVGAGVAKCEYGITVRRRASGQSARIVAVSIVLYDHLGNYVVCDEGDTTLYNSSGGVI